jgi:hypothetical protein
VAGKYLREFQKQQKPLRFKVGVFVLLQHAALTLRTYWPTAVFSNETLGALAAQVGRKIEKHLRNALGVRWLPRGAGPT